MPWFYNSISGELANESGASALVYETFIHAGIGWHQLNISSSASFAQASAEALKEVPGGATPTGGQVQGLENVGAGAVQGIGQAAASTISSTVFGPLYQKNIWVRGGEIVIGALLIGIGINAMLKGRPLQVITAPVAALGKAVP